MLCPLFEMDVIPAGHSWQHSENCFSIKMQELELCPERATKHTAPWDTCHVGPSGYLPDPSARRASLSPAGSLPEAFNAVACLSLNQALSESESTGHHTCFTDGQAGSTARSPQNRLGSKCLASMAGRKVVLCAQHLVVCSVFLPPGQPSQ